MRYALLLFLITAAFHSTRADDLDVIVDSTLAPEARGQAYGRLSSVDFPTIALKLARLRGVYPTFLRRGTGSAFITQPWLDTSLSEKGRIAHTLSLLWNERVKTVGHPQKLRLMIDLLEEPATQDIKWLPLMEIASVLHDDHEQPDPALPPLTEVLPHLEKFAADPATSGHDRGMALQILFERGDANRYLELALKYSSLETNPIARNYTFREYTPIDQSRLSEANRRKFLRHGFALLGEVDDKKGAGFELATHLGKFLQIPPEQPGEAPFAPDRQSPRYESPESGKENYWQDTVIHAWKWLLTHEGEY